MKASELMMGDWLLNEYTHDYFKVYPSMFSQITNFGENPNIDCEKFGIKPIPLTAEILEKNGFKRHNRYQYIYKDNYCKVCVSIAPRIEIDGMDLGEPPINVSIEGALFDIDMSMSAIHELQHALRLCGIDKEIVL